MFADYRVPQILQAKGVMVYDQDLKALIESGAQLPSGGAAESEIRAVTVQVRTRTLSLPPSCPSKSARNPLFSRGCLETSFRPGRWDGWTRSDLAL